MHKIKWLWATLICISFLLGLVVRFYDLTDPPLDFHPTRQLHSALIARGMYYQTRSDVPDWQKNLSLQQWKAQGLIEPQIMERLTATTYQMAGHENLWFARVWAIIFWAVGGFFLFLLAKDIAGLPGSVIVVVYYMNMPYTITASRAFQPEPLMMAAIIFALWASNQWINKRRILWAIFAGIACGFAIYVKSVAVFFLAPSLAGLVLTNFKWKEAIRNSHVWIILLLSILPYAAYHIYGVYGVGLLGEQFGLRFFPSLWVDPVYYLRWLNEMNRVVGFEFFLVAMIGIVLFAPKQKAGFLAGFVVGYLLYGLTFSYHISTHDYYHLPLVVPVAIGLALIFGNLIKAKDKLSVYQYAAVAIVLLSFMVIKSWDARVSLKRTNYQNEVRFWEKLGERIPNGKQVIGLLPDYGHRLAYWGWTPVTAWSSSSDQALRALAGQDVDTDIAADLGNEDYDLFIITDMAEYEKQPALKEYLESNFPAVEQTSEVIIFDLKGQFANDS